MTHFKKNHFQRCFLRTERTSVLQSFHHNRLRPAKWPGCLDAAVKGSGCSDAADADAAVVGPVARRWPRPPPAASSFPTQSFNKLRI